MFEYAKKKIMKLKSRWRYWICYAGQAYEYINY